MAPLLALCLLILAAGAAWAGVTGKIAGVVTNVQTGEPIVNASVVIAGTDFGAATSSDGDYFIINVPPGAYSVKVSYVGYVSLTKSAVTIYADFTTNLDFQLTPTVIAGQEVVVKAERKVLRQDVTASSRLTTGDEIYNMPVATYVGALATVAGAVGDGNNIHIRGGRRGQVAYLIDGMEVKDPLLDLRMMNIGNPAVAEMIAMTGGFDAEFGNAQSAVVNVVTKEGTKEYHGQIKYVFDDLSPKPSGKFEEATAPNGTRTLWTPPSQYQNYDYLEGSLGGPEPITSQLLPRLGLNIPGYMTFFASADLTARNTTSNGVRIFSSPSMRHDASSWLGLDDRREQTFLDHSYQLTYHMNPKVKLKAAYRNSRSWTNPYYLRLSRNFPDDYSQEDVNAAFQAWTGNDATYTYVHGADDDGDGRVDEEALNGKDDDLDGLVDEDLQSYEFNASDHNRFSTINDEQLLLTWNHTLNQRTYYNVKLSRYKAERTLKGANKNPDQYGEYAEPFTDLPDSKGKYNGNYDVGEPFVDKDSDGVWDEGNQANNYLNYRGFFFTGDGLSGDVGQLVPSWIEEKSFVYGLKFQLTSQLHRNHQVRAGLDYNYFDIHSGTYPYPTIDNLGKGIYTDVYRVYPADGALYLQDKMEYKDITLTLGSRLDWFTAGNQVRHVMAFDTLNPNWTPNYVPFDVPERVKSFVSPRLGVSYAISENAYLHAHYGHFYQRPRWDDVFGSVNQSQTGGTPLIGNPDLDPEKTVAYEVGVSYNPYKDYLVDVSGFLKDIKNWINTRDGKDWFPEHFGIPLIGQNYAINDNQDYAFARGLEINLSKEYGANVSGRITYTLSWVNAKNSYNNETQIIRSDYVEPTQALPAGWDRRHSVVANFGLNYGPNEPLFGVRGMPGDWTFNLLWNMGSGLPYTPTDASNTRIQGQEMSKRTPWTYNADLNAAKYFTVGRWRTSLWLEVRNVFNRQNVLQVDDNYGRAGEPNSWDDYTGTAGWVNDTSSPDYVQNPYAGPNPDAWDNPRFLRLGLGLQF
jgi:outer membrane receptor protein involved in Fe transport